MLTVLECIIIIFELSFVKYGLCACRPSTNLFLLFPLSLSPGITNHEASLLLMGWHPIILFYLQPAYLFKYKNVLLYFTVCVCVYVRLMFFFDVYDYAQAPTVYLCKS